MKVNLFKNRNGENGRRLRLFSLVLLPALAAGILFWRIDKDPRYSYLGKAGAGMETAAGENGTSFPIRLFGSAGEAPDAKPIQKIAFTAGGDDLQQRSLPVHIAAPPTAIASAQGNGSEGQIWAVFLPAEIAENPHILFTEYENVSFEPVEGIGDSGNGGSGKEEKEASGKDSEDAAGNGKGKETIYSSGDPLSRPTNGSVFTVRMTSREGNVSEELLYVYSCSDTASMYLDTESGSMEKVDGDASKQTSESARYLVFSQDGSIDSEGKCSVSGRGNSTWTRKKRPYNLNLVETDEILGMEPCKKLCLLSNSFDESNILDRISAQLADGLGMRDTPDGEFVNVYLNGAYNGLYYLSQRVRTGGSVHIDDLNGRILAANTKGADTGTASSAAGSPEGGTTSQSSTGGNSLHLPKKIRLSQEGDPLQKWAYDWPAEPADQSGGYLLQVHEGYSGDDCWFSTEHKRFRVTSPSYPTKEEVDYLQDYLLTAERALYSEDGIDPETGLSYESILDMPSWEDMFLLEELFVEWDAERWSFFITKDRGDPLLYCGPMWDFDHSAGTMLYGNYPETAISTLLFQDDRIGWMNRLLTHESFSESVRERWKTRFSPALHSFLEGNEDRSGRDLTDKNSSSLSIEKEIAAIESSANMNNVRRNNETTYSDEALRIRGWLTRRVAFLDDYFEHPDDYCRVVFQFSWGQLSHYVPRGQVLGYLPLPEYGETQIPSQIETNEILGWKGEDGKEISADIRIEKDRTFQPVYKEKENKNKISD